MSHSPESETPSVKLPGWGHGASLLKLGDAVRADGAAAAMDRQLFSERIARYCWAYDERQIDQLANCFSEDGVWEGNVLGQIPIGPFTGRERVVKWLSEFWPHQHDQRRHMILNTIVEAQSDHAATTLSYLLLMSSNGQSPKIETTGFYKVQYVREGEQWLIQRLSAGFDAPFWPGDINKMSRSGRARHGVDVES